jgi:cysteine desulfurase/selenocysteine lyase
VTRVSNDPRPAIAFDVDTVRARFPILSRTVRGKPLVYLDNAATTQKPESVIEAEAAFYRTSNANAHRGVHTLGHEATLSLESARSKVARFLNAESSDEVIFTAGATASLNLAAHSLGSLLLTPGDEILLTQMEHHANIVPWQMIASRFGATIRAIPVRDDGVLDLDALDTLLTDRTKILSLTHISNVLGTRNPIADIAARAHARGVTVVVDGCQAVAHERVDVRRLGADLYAFGAHKMYGPLGVGALWGRHELLDRMPPFQTGGGMIRRVSFEETTFAEPPTRLEPGTPNIAGAVGLAAAIEFLHALDREAVAAHELALHARMISGMRGIPGVTMLTDQPDRAPIESFTIEGGHPHDIATILDMHGVAVRAGHHCAQPLMDRFGLSATLRASIACYNTAHEVDSFISALANAAEALR